MLFNSILFYFSLPCTTFYFYFFYTTDHVFSPPPPPNTININALLNRLYFVAGNICQLDLENSST